jgi:hypothetical protein
MTQTHELDCSDAAKMLIERMQTNPEEFDSPRGKFGRVLENTYSERDKKAITKAHDLHIKEPRLMVYMLEALLVQPEDDAERAYRTGLGRAGTLGVTGTTVNKMWFDANTETVNGITREMYEAQLQAHKSPIKQHIQAVRAEKESIAAQIHNKFFSDRIERDN